MIDSNEVIQRQQDIKTLEDAVLDSEVERIFNTARLSLSRIILEMKMEERAKKIGRK